jgi:hypothetical protein
MDERTAPTLVRKSSSSLVLVLVPCCSTARKKDEHEVEEGNASLFAAFEHATESANWWRPSHQASITIASTTTVASLDIGCSKPGGLSRI